METKFTDIITIAGYGIDHINQELSQYNATSGS